MMHKWFSILTHKHQNLGQVYRVKDLLSSFTGQISSKGEIRISKIMLYFCGFNCQKWKINENKTSTRLLHLDLVSSQKHRRKTENFCFIICGSYLIYSQIWLNLLKDDCQFLYIFLWCSLLLGCTQKFIKKKTEKVRILLQCTWAHIF
jgi:hypothetical protein